MKTFILCPILIWIGLVGANLVWVDVSYTEIDPNSVIAAFMFDDIDADDVVEDLSGRRNHAIREGGKIDYEDGPFGSAVEFKPGAKACLHIKKPGLLNHLPAFTMVGWFNRDPGTPWAEFNAWVGQHAAIEWWMARASVVNVFTFPTTESRPVARHRLPHPHPNQGCVLAKDCVWNSVKLPADAGSEKWNESGTFVHMAVTGDTTNLIMYKNGRAGLKKKVNKLAGIGPLVTYGASDEDVYIGGCGVLDSADSGAGNHFPGLMDEIAIFDVALEKADIINIRDNGLESIGLLGLAVQPVDKLAVTWGEMKTR